MGTMKKLSIRLPDLKLCILPLILLAAILLLPACNRIPKGNPADGVRWFRMHRCNGCHGKGGRGARGPAIASLQISFDHFLSKLRDPQSAVMPTFPPNELSDQDAADIYLWLRKQSKTADRG